uniref:Uncharacterized protein n=1 Tax=Panagrolaimus sp. PS1159 TaxID=55785 RepID=A0AC35GBF3_9BILA
MSSPGGNAESSMQQTNVAEHVLEKKEPCVALMVATLYKNAGYAAFAPNIFGRPEILNNSNGKNHIESIIEALKRHTQK